MKHTQLALAVGLAVTMPAGLYIESAHAQTARTLVSSTVRTQTVVVVLSSGTPSVTTTVQSNTVTRTLADGSVVRETTPITYTITRTPQTIRTDTIELTTTVFSDKTTSVTQRVLSSVTSTRINQTQSGVRGAVQTVVVSGPTTVTSTANTSTTPAGTFNASTYYNNAAIGTPTAVPSNDPAFYRTTEANNKAVTIVGAEYAYARGWTGRGSTVLIMDTGVNAAHPDLAGKIKYQRDFTNTGITDTNGHGTHVAGIVAANRNGQGTHGIAFDSNLAIAKIASGSNFNMQSAQAAMSWASQYSDVVVANLSANIVYSRDYIAAMQQVAPGVFVNNHQHYGGTKYYNLETPQGWNIPNNMVLTVSAGNSNLGYVQSPAVFAVATDPAGNLVLGGRMLVVGNWNAGLGVVEGAKSGHVCKNFQNNSCQDKYRLSDFYILAPGSAVVSTAFNSTGTRTMSGTSQAAPVVAGAVAIINQLWPYMTAENQVQLLLKTANKNLPGYDVNTHGQGLLDLDRATQPVGTLGISTTGRAGTVQPITGISIAGSTAQIQGKLSSVSAVDSMQRDFQVDLSGAVMQNQLIRNPMGMMHTPGQSWSNKLIGVYNQQFPGFALGQTATNTSLSLSSESFGHTGPGRHQFTLSRSNFNPFIQYSGAWGSINDSTTFEYDYLHKMGSNLYTQAGVMSTSTNSSPGLIQRVGNIYSIHAAVGYKQDRYNVYAGIQPWTIAGDLHLRLPTYTDAQGTMHYENSRASLAGSRPISYVGMNYQQPLGRMSSATIGFTATQMGDYRVLTNFTRTF